MQNSSTMTEQDRLIQEAKAKEERARNILSTSADFVEDSKIDAMFIDKVLEIINSDKVDANTKALVTTMAALNDQLVLMNRAMSVMLQQQASMLQLQAQQLQGGRLQMPRQPIVGIQ